MVVTSALKWAPRHHGPWTGLDWSAPRVGEAALDPYLCWAEFDGFRSLCKPAPGRVPVLLEVAWDVKLEPPLSGEMVARLERAGLTLSPIYLANGAGLREPWSFITGMASPEFFRNALSGPYRPFFRAVELGLPTVVGAPGPRMSAPGGERGEAPLRHSRGPVVGIVDDGIAFAHARFRAPGGRATRVLAVWDQDRVPAGGDTTPRDLGYGVELDAKRLADALAHAPSDDEPAIYAALGYRRAQRRVTHGTHVLDVAAGADDGSGPPIVAVQLPRDVVRDTSALGLGPCLLDALHFILNQARAANPHAAHPPEVAVNLSYVTSRGQRKGESMLERALDDLCVKASERARFSVAVPAGNHRQARCHAQVTLAPGKRGRVLHWRVLPDDRTPSFMELWCNEAPLLDDGTSRLDVTVRPPAGRPSGAIGCPGVEVLETRGGELVGAVVCLDRVAGGRGTMVLVAVSPTASLDARALAPAGVWEIELHNRGPEAVTVDAWIQRDESVDGFPRSGRQSYFDDPHDRRAERSPLDEREDPATYVKRRGTLSGLAGGQRATAVGALREADRQRARYSGEGLTPGKPDVVAVSDRSRVLGGVLGAGTFSGSRVALDGTSVATPQEVRRLVTPANAPRTKPGPVAKPRPPVGAPPAWTTGGRDEDGRPRPPPTSGRAAP